MIQFYPRARAVHARGNAGDEIAYTTYDTIRARDYSGERLWGEKVRGIVSMFVSGNLGDLGDVSRVVDGSMTRTRKGRYDADGEAEHR